MNTGGVKHIPQITVQPWETEVEVMAREGVEPAKNQARGVPTLIVRQIVDPLKSTNDISDICEPAPKE